MLEDTIFHLGEDLDFNFIDGDGWVTHYFEPKILQAFGDGKPAIKLIKNELEKLLAAHNDTEVYMPTDYHFKLLDRLLVIWCEIYNDFSKEYDEDPKSKGAVLRINDKPIYEIDPGSLMDIFFWDSDYDFDPEVAARLMNNSLKEKFDISGDALNASMLRSPDTSDLNIVKMDPPDNWEEDCSSIWFPDTVDVTEE